ncbi:MAG: hypothetical protein LBD45_09800, partial [Bacteroidales bacterium]|nr:hypothetical protein [Bacteroidales bacterium]
MKKTFLVSCLLSLGVTAWAQTDVTSSYLTNAGFDESADYYTGANLGSANGGANIRMVTGWTIDGYGDNSAASAYAIASSSQLNGNTPPATNYSGGADGGVLGISSAWGAQNKYSQTVTLPAGKYDLVYAYYNGGPNAADNSLVGWIPTIGTSVMSSKTSFALNTWGTEALTFILTESTEGKIQIGVGAPGVGSANVGRIFFDYVKLEFTDLFAQVNALKARLTELKDDANLPVAYDLSVANTLTGLNPTADQITGWLSDANDEIAAMEAAIAANQDATLSDLQINGVTIAGFSSSTYTYTYGVAPGTMPGAVAVSATKSSAYAGV